MPANTLRKPLISAKPKAFYIGMNCKEENIHKIKQISDYLDVPVYKMYFDHENDRFELRYSEI